MLRISLREEPDQTVILRLAGQVKGPWVEELRKACEEVMAAGRGLILDLTDVSFMDRAGIVLCHSLQDQRVELTRCSPFVAEQLKG